MPADTELWPRLLARIVALESSGSLLAHWNSDASCYLSSLDKKTDVHLLRKPGGRVAAIHLGSFQESTLADENDFDAFLRDVFPLK